MVEAAPSRLRLYLDTADTELWHRWAPTGLFYGVTTNPLLLERAQLACSRDKLEDLARAAFALGMKEAQLQTWGETAQEMVANGEALGAIDPRVVVKVPVTRTGTEAAAELMAAGCRVTLTGVYAVHQVLIGAAMGAEYVAPYLGRINDLGCNGREDLAQMQRVLTGVGSGTRILTASIRSVGDLTYLAAQGLDTFTVSPAIAAGLFEVEATQRAAADFQRAAVATSVTDART